MTNIWVVCIDGTWNTPGQTDTDPLDQQEAVTKTNVQVVWEVLTQTVLSDTSPYGSVEPLAHQVGMALYLNGVGSSGTERLRSFEGSTGTGTSERIMDAYQFLAQRWQPGDLIFGFGFSRGAFALRSLMGFINWVGMPIHPRMLGSTELLSQFESYRKAPSQFTKAATMQTADIHFVGVWDTVGALAFGYGFNNFHQLSPANIQRVCQALALDEQRKEFLPEYFKSASTEQQIDEVWFVGAHSNIGGGYVDRNLSDIALFWMLHNAKNAGLEIDLSAIPGWNVQNPQGEIRQSYNEFWNAMPDIGKFIEKLNLLKVNRKILAGQKLHASVIDAMATGYIPAAQPASGDAITSISVESRSF